LSILQQLVLELKRALRDGARKAEEKTTEIGATCVISCFDVVLQSDQFSLLESKSKRGLYRISMEEFQMYGSDGSRFLKMSIERRNK